MGESIRGGGILTRNWKKPGERIGGCLTPWINEQSCSGGDNEQRTNCSLWKVFQLKATFCVSCAKKRKKKERNRRRLSLGLNNWIEKKRGGIVLLHLSLIILDKFKRRVKNVNTRRISILYEECSTLVLNCKKKTLFFFFFCFVNLVMQMHSLWMISTFFYRNKIRKIVLYF